MTDAQMEQVGQYVLGLLEGETLVQFERELAADIELINAVAQLQSRMLALDNAYPVPPGPALWERIEQQILVAEGKPTDGVVPKPERRRMSRQWMAMAASVLFALGTGYLAGSFSAGQSQPIMIAVLINENDATPGVIVEAFADDSVRLVPLEQFDVPEGRILQVWTLPDPATGPVSLGTFADAATIRLTGPDLPTPHAGQLYEITVEPAPGSPTGRPTGPILVKGFARAPV
jgi:anti-sigma-K factor RskA